MTRALLTGHGRMPWPDARRLLAGHTCAWADLDGFHLTSAPKEAPLTATLWSWQNETLMRLRIDGPAAIVGRLDLSPHPGDPSSGSEPVDVTVRKSSTWAVDEARVSVPEKWRDREVTLYEVIGLMPLTFVKMA
jgi:hypothetical protein